MTVTKRIFDKQIFTLNGIAPDGGTATADVRVLLDYVFYLEATIVLIYSTAGPAGHVAGGAGLKATYVIENRNDVLAAPAAITGSANPDNSSGMVAATAEASDINSGAAAPPTAAWTISTVNARLTVTNNFNIAVDAVVFVDICGVKNV